MEEPQTKPPRKLNYREGSVPPTVQSHGHTWTKHTPGDPPPVSESTEIYVLLEGGVLIDEPIVARNLNWGECEYKHLYNIKGYRLATPLAEEPSELDRLKSENKKLHETCALYAAQIEDAVDIIDGTEPGIDWGDLSKPELIRKLSEHCAAWRHTPSARGQIKKLRAERESMRVAINDACNEIELLHIDRRDSALLKSIP
jgi:hypothetical protein